MTKHSSSLFFNIKNKTLFKYLFSKLFSFQKKDCIYCGVEKQNRIANRILNYHYDCSKPRTFNEFLGWLKYNYKNDLWKKCADKLGSKEFLIENGLERFVVKTLGIYKESKNINLDMLPEKFVLKTNHDSGTVFICDKATTDFETIFKKLDRSLKRRYEYNNDEWVYENITPLIFAEELLYPCQSRIIVDYKLFGFGGRFGWGFTGQNRDIDTRFVVFENDFEIQNVEYIYLKPRKKEIVSKPEHFDEMVKITEFLSKLLGFVRVDFFETTEGLKIGELTFFSQSGYGPFTKKQYDFKYGHFFKEMDFVNKNKL